MTLFDSSRFGQPMSVPLDEVFGESSLRFAQVVYDTTFDFLRKIHSVLVDEHHAVEEGRYFDSYRADSEISDGVEIYPESIKYPDFSSKVRVTVLHSWEYYDVGRSALEEMSQLANFDYNHRKEEKTLKSVIKNLFEKQIPKNDLFQNQFFVRISEPDIWVVPKFIENPASYSVLFDFTFFVEDNEALKVGGRAYEKVARETRVGRPKE